MDSTESAAVMVDCAHCGQRLTADQKLYCCAGCRSVHRLMKDSGLERYYELRSDRILPLLNYFDRSESLAWIEKERAYEKGELKLSVEGVQCGACVWAMQELARRAGGASLNVNTALGQLELQFDSKHFDARAYFEKLRDLGYRVRPLDQADLRTGRGLLLRLGVCAAIAMNTMFFSIAVYLGLNSDGTGLYEAMRHGNFALSVVAVMVGGSYFITRAWRALRAGVAHFDIPVALGIVAAFTGSAWAHWTGAEHRVYFDTVNIFITLMLAGRFVQERALLRNRKALLASDSFDRHQVTLVGKAPREINFKEVLEGDELLLQAGAMTPVNATLESKHALEFDQASSSGESEPILVKPGELVPAGSRLASLTAARVKATMPFQRSLLAALLPVNAEQDLPVIWAWTARWYTILVIVAAFGGLAYWSRVDASLAADVFIATLVVTCPCALGVAVPLARQLANRRLAASGVMARKAGLLDDLAEVKKIFLDKTGTLTLASLKWTNVELADDLSDEDRAALMSASMSSRHPVSRTLFQELSARGQQTLDGHAEEIPGQGVDWIRAKNRWSLQRPREQAGVDFLKNGKTLAHFEFEEQTLEGARKALQALKDLGMQIKLISGDQPSKVAAMAKKLGLLSSAARQAPQEKAQAVTGRDSLMLGDGLNDGPAMQAAHVSGSPAWERSPVADQAAFTFTSTSLAWLPAMFATASRLKKVVWANLAFTAFYNSVMVALALAGLVSPLLCAIVMPLSSLLVIAATSRAMEKA